MAPPIAYQSRAHVHPFPLGNVAALAGAALSAQAAEVERPVVDPRGCQLSRSPEKQRRSEKSSDGQSSEQSFNPTDRHRLSYIRPTNWKGVEHSQALLAVWAALSQVESVGPSPRPFHTETSNATGDAQDAQKKLDVAEEGLRKAFPALALGRVKLGREWVLYVLGREGLGRSVDSEDGSGV